MRTVHTIRIPFILCLFLCLGVFYRSYCPLGNEESGPVVSGLYKKLVVPEDYYSADDSAVGGDLRADTHGISHFLCFLFLLLLRSVHSKIEESYQKKDGKTHGECTAECGRLFLLFVRGGTVGLRSACAVICGAANCCENGKAYAHQNCEHQKYNKACL